MNERSSKLLSTVMTQLPLVTFKRYSSSHLDEVNAALREADVVICATPSTTPLFESSSIRDGTHVILVGSYTPSMHEVDSNLIQRAVSSKSLLVDSWEACSVEAGELIDAEVKQEDAKEIGTLVSFEGDELTLLKQQHQPALSGGFSGPITLFKSVGVGLQDVAIAIAVVAQAEKIGTGVLVMNYD